MKYLLRSVLIVDPKLNTGRDLEIYIKENNIAADVAVAHDSWSAMNYIKQRLAVGKSLPNLTLLDTDLPEFNAWDFIEMVNTEIGKSIYHQIYLLSSNADTHDLIRASINPIASGVINKPLTDVEIDRIALDYAEKFIQNVA